MPEPLSVLFLLDDSSLAGVDCRDVTAGNPGMGGAEYLFVALAYELSLRGIARTVLAHSSVSNLYPSSISRAALPNSLETSWTDREAAQAARQASYVVVRGYNETRKMLRVVQAIPGHAPVIVWAHNHLRWHTYAYLGREPRVRSIVFAGREQRALAAGTAALAKSVWIPNGFYPPTVNQDGAGQPGKTARAVYAGNLAPSKGFHRLARLWPRIRRTCPAAELDVIGSARLYGGGTPLGPAGLAQPEYEKKILAYLDHDPARHGVVFHGKLGLEKFGIMQRSQVGLPNPTGFTECCPGAVLELSACANAIVAPRRWGMCDTVEDRVTGRLCDSEEEYVREAAALLSDPGAALRMGRAGQRFVRDHFNFARVCGDWQALFDRLEGRRSPQPVAAEAPLKGRYPLQSLRNPAYAAGLGSLVSGFDRVHGWVLRRF